MSVRAEHLPALKAAVAAAAGIVIGRSFPQDPAIFFLAGLVSIMSSFAILRGIGGRSRALLSLGAYSSIALVFAFHMSLNLSALKDVKLSDFHFFTGTVNETQRDASKLSMTLADCYGYNGGWRKIDGEVIVTPRSRLGLQVGDRVIFKGHAGSVSGARNPGEFDMKTYYQLLGVAGRVFLDSAEDILLVRHTSGFDFSRDVVDRARNLVRAGISSSLHGDVAGLAKAMVLGERGGINREINEQFINSGTIHILSVSGLHIGFLAGILVTLASVFSISRRWRFFFIAPVLVFYGLIVGMGPSVFRAVIMGIVILFGAFLQRRSTILNSLGFAALVILVVTPAQLFMASFQLSFAAVLSIAFFYERLLAMVRSAFPRLADRPWLNPAVSITVLTVSATLGTIPLTAFYFGRVSLVSVVANFFIVPLSGVFLSLCFTFLLAGIVSGFVPSLFGAAAQIVGFLILETNSVIGSASFSTVRIGEEGLLFAALYFAWMIASIWFGGRSLMKKAVFASLLGANLILFSGIFTYRTEARCYALDVGQGDAIFLELPGGSTMLIDAGMKFGRNDAGTRVIVPFLKRMGINKVDYFVVTHLHSDHIGGAVGVLRNLKVKNFIYPEQVSHSRTWDETMTAVRLLGIPSGRGAAGMVLDSGPAYRVYILHPNRFYVGKGANSYRTRYNNGSVVLKVSVGPNSLLLVGDAEREVEHDLCRAYGPFLSAAVLKIGHHGSSTSSSEEFIDEVRPKNAIVSVGAGNSFGHPSPEVISSLRDRGVGVWRTDIQGAAYVKVGMENARLIEWR